MIKRCTIEDLECLDNITKEIYDLATDDGCVDIEDFTLKEVLPNDKLYFLKALDGDKIMGYYMFHPWNNATYECHANFPKGSRSKTLEFGHEAAKWMFENTSCLKIIALAPTLYMYVYKHCLKIGFKEEGKLEKSYMKNGVLYDQYIMGLCKEVS